MTLQSRKAIVDFYEARLDEFGYDVRSVGWGNKGSQDLRFKILSDIGDLTNNSVCDLGCGFGDLYLYLKSCPKVKVNIIT